MGHDALNQVVVLGGGAQAGPGVAAAHADDAGRGFAQGADPVVPAGVVGVGGDVGRAGEVFDLNGLEAVDQDFAVVRISRAEQDAANLRTALRKRAEAADGVRLDFVHRIACDGNVRCAAMKSFPHRKT